MNPTATQLNENPFEEPAASSSQNTKFFKGLTGRVDISEDIRPPTPRVRGYNFVSTPLPNPDAACSESLMITWGEIEGSTFLLDASDKLIKPVTSGPVFKLKDEPKRDRIGRELAGKVAKQYRDKKAQAVERIKHLTPL